MRRMPTLHLLGLALMLTRGAGTLPAAPFDSLKPMVIVSFGSHERIMQRATLGFQGLGFDPGAALFRRQFERLLLVDDLQGIDTTMPGHLFLLTADPPDALPVQAAILPVSDVSGTVLLTSLKRRYREQTERHGVHTFSDPHSLASPALISVAVAEKHALISTRIDGVRWLALQRRDRTLPAAGAIGTPLRITVDGGLFGLFLQLYAALTPRGAHADLAGPGRLEGHLHEIGQLCAAFESIDAGLDAGIRDFALTLRLNAATNTPLAARIAALQTPADTLSHLLPATRLVGGASTLPALIDALPESTGAWLENLADDTQLLGLRVAPRMRGWLDLLLPVFDGQHAAAVFAPASGQGICCAQIFRFSSAAKARAALDLLEGLLRPADRPDPSIVPFPSRKLGDARIIGYRTVVQVSTNAPWFAGLGQVLTHLLQLNHVEMACRDDNLFIARGPTASIDALLTRPPDTQSPSSLEISRREFPPLRPTQTLVGAGRIALMAVLRVMAERLPGLNREKVLLPLPGDAFHWRAASEASSLTWQIYLPSNELMSLNHLRTLDAAAIQDLLSHFVLDQFSQSANPEAERR